MTPSVVMLLCLLMASVGPILTTAEAQKVKVADAVVVTKTRDTYTVVWQAIEDGTVRTSGLTTAEYEALGAVDAAPPSQQHLPSNRTWVFVSASKNDEYSTPSGKLEAGSIYQVADKIAVILDDGEQITLDKKAHTVTDDAGKGVTITPDPSGFQVKDGAITKEKP